MDALTRDDAPPEPQRHHIELRQLVPPAGDAGDAAPAGDAGAALLAMLQHHQPRELAMLAPAGDAEGTTLLAGMDHGLSSSSGTALLCNAPGEQLVASDFLTLSEISISVIAELNQNIIIVVIIIRGDG